MIPQTYLRLPEPVTVDLRIATGPRPRVVTPGVIPSPDDPEHVPVPNVLDILPLVLMLDSPAREIAAHLPPIPGRLVIYGPEDFAAAAGDTPEQHAQRVLQILGSDPAGVLQALIDGHELPPLPLRVPRELPNWRVKAVLMQMGELDAVEELFTQLPDDLRGIVLLAWNGDNRRGPRMVRCGD